MTHNILLFLPFCQLALDRHIHSMYIECMQMQTLNITLPRDLVAKADLLAEAEYKTRSELVKILLQDYIKEKTAWEQIFEAGAKAAKKLGIKSEEDVYKIVSDYRHAKSHRKSSS